MLSEALVELALRPWGRERLGMLLHRTAERLVELQPSLPFPGPNCVCLVRCAPERVEAIVHETREIAAAHGLRCNWILDPDARPVDLPERLAACGFELQEELEAMAFPASASLGPVPPGIEIVDALDDDGAFSAAEAVQAQAFGGDVPARASDRLAEGRADPDRHFLLARIDGEPAGAGWATIYREGARLNGGAVAPRFRGRGAYRALVAARADIARRHGAPGLTTQAKLDTSAPILARLGFVPVGGWRLYRDVDPG